MMAYHLEIMNKIPTPSFTHVCPDCNTRTYCAMEAGKSSSTCWCMTEPIRESDPNTNFDRCLCKNCLKG